MFDDLLTDTIDIYRSQAAGIGVQTSYGTSPYNSGVQCLIQPIQPEYMSKTDMNYGREYRCIFADTNVDISVSDRVVDENGKTYQVTGTYDFNYQVTSIAHFSVMLTEEATQGPDV